MATAINADVLYKTANGYQRAIIQRAYTVTGVVVDNTAATDASIYCADLLVSGVAQVKLNKVVREDKVGTANSVNAQPVQSGYSAVSTNGTIAAGTNADTTSLNMKVGSWFIFS